MNSGSVFCAAVFGERGYDGATFPEIAIAPTLTKNQATFASKAGALPRGGGANPRTRCCGRHQAWARREPTLVGRCVVDFAMEADAVARPRRIPGHHRPDQRRKVVGPGNDAVQRATEEPGLGSMRSNAVN